MSRILASVNALALLLAACGNGSPPVALDSTLTTTMSTPGSTSSPTTGAPTTVTTAEETTTTTPTLIPRCDDIGQISASPEEYRPTPLYFGNEMPVDQVRVWAETRPGFEEIWIDRHHSGWITVRFSRDVEARKRDLATLFPDVGVVAVHIKSTRAELEEVRGRVSSELHGVLSSFGVGLAVHRGVVTIDVGPLTAEVLGFLDEHFGDDPVCVEGFDPALLPEPGPQALAGDGWRLLADEPGVGRTYQTGIATNEAGLESLWATAGLPGPLPEVDFQAEVAIWFGAVFGSSCPNLRLDDVVVEDSLVYAVIVLTDWQVVCTMDARPRAYVVAVQRSKLPVGPFAIQLDADSPSSGSTERTTVDVDLSPPGAIATPEQIHNDPYPEQRRVMESGAIIEPDYRFWYRLDARCGIEWLGEVNWYWWRTTQPMPPQWNALLSPEGTIEVIVELRLQPEPVIAATEAGVTVEYTPGNDPAPTCP